MGKEVKYKSFEPCCACGLNADDMVCEHHVYTRKAYPEHSEKAWNKMPLCLMCHVMIHKIGTSSMANKFYGVRGWLEKNGWHLDEFMKRWARISSGVGSCD